MRQKKYGPNERTDQNSKIELSAEEIANLSDAEFKAQIIRMLPEMGEYGCKMMTLKSEIKEGIQGTKSEGKETGTQTKDLKQNEERNIQPEQNEQRRIQKKMRRG